MHTKIQAGCNQQALDADLNGIHQNNFTGNLERSGKAIT